MTRLARSGAGSVAGLALFVLLPLGGAAFAPIARAAEGVGITISGVDVSGYPDVSLEISAPATVTGGVLDASSIAVTENGAPVAITVEPVSTTTLEVVLLIDASGSMKGAALTAAKSAAAAFLAVLPGEVPVGVISFADHVAVTSPMTLDRGALVASINTLSARGETSLYDAVVFAPTLFSSAAADRQMVLLSDGGDTVSRATLQQAVGVAATIRTSAIQLNSSEANRDALIQIAAAGHGTLSEATNPAALQGLYEAVANSLVHRYRLHVTATTNGDTTYGVSVTTSKGVLSASTQVALPAATTTIPATTLPAATVPATIAPTSDAGGGTATTTQTTLVIAGGAVSGNSDSKGLLLVGAAMVFAAILMLGLTAWPARRRRHTLMPVVREGLPAAVTPEDSGIGAQVSDRVERALEGRGRRSGLAQALDVANIRLRPGEFLVLVFSGGVTLAALLGFLISWPGIILGLVLAPLAAGMFINIRAHRRRRAFLEQLPDVLQMLVNSLRSGFGLPQALDSVAGQVAEPARTELGRVLFEVRIGRDPSDALAAAATRMKSRDFEWVVSAMNINRDVGGDLAAILETVAETVRERLQLARQVRTLTAEGRLSAYILVALPFILAGLLAIVNPGYYAPMKESPGPQLIALGVAMLIVGTLWMRRLVKTQM